MSLTVDAFLELVEDKLPPAPEEQILELEGDLGVMLPEDYRRFLQLCNGGYVGGALWFFGRDSEGEEIEVGVHHINGFREESYLSLVWSRECYQGEELRIPRELLPIMDDPFGNAICIGLTARHRGRVYFWDHEEEPDPDEWDGALDTAGNITLVCESFSEFVAGLRQNEEE